jgi:hypothetical protein
MAKVMKQISESVIKCVSVSVAMAGAISMAIVSIRNESYQQPVMAL